MIGHNVELGCEQRDNIARGIREQEEEAKQPLLACPRVLPEVA